MKWFSTVVLALVVVAGCKETAPVEHVSSKQVEAVEKKGVRKPEKPAKKEESQVPQQRASAQINPMTFSDFKAAYLTVDPDSVNIINFWSTRHPRSLDDLKNFTMMYEQGKDINVNVVLVNMDLENDLESKVKPLLQSRDLNMNMVHLPMEGDWIKEIDADWDGTPPATLFLKEGARKFYTKPFGEDCLNCDIKVFKLKGE